MANFTDGNTNVCGLIGNPVRHTLSPLIHNSLAEITGINMVYVPFEVAEGDVSDAVKGALALGVRGLNVTIPYKSDVIPCLEDIDPLAKAIGAVNTLVRTPNGGFKGYNTDMTGLYHSMQDEGVELEGRTVVILGAGGVARPAAFLCASKGAKKVYILNRTYERAMDVAGEVNRALFDLSREDLVTADGINAEGDPLDIPEIVVPMKIENYRDLYEEKEKFITLQCTSVGLFPDVNSAIIEDSEFYEHISVGIDMVYRPLETKFMKLTAEAGAKAVSGLKMLLYQAIDAYELWFESELFAEMQKSGEDKKTDAEQKAVKISKEQADEIYKSLVMEVTGARNIILEGFMGSGKTTVSEILADKLDLELLDTDAAIVEAEGRSISDIFETDGEESFRDMETALLETASSEHFREMVISLGGGLVLRKENRELLQELGKVVYLRTKPETVYERVRYDDSRPLLKTADPLSTIRKMQSDRGSIYELAADFIIDTDDLTPSEIADRIIEELGIVIV
ncbi:shikimate 5-dehydrogenase/shikimate kinase [Butyrivibrio proteoclasticus B316]|uniref:Multifunctional fusion protein n=1 Tax=Butyrivibrio proteoclasticus (strain ATCC 51982 / DSM 14932 / B316) TaxID=515622 RepID=E0RWR2_BUTPB|nr:shikimate kinase [Butyrivibrio proteoclasticus]ADL34588.1 shikimate 5-dehydrogenase/shikimate kinase [Butyrivibrio proteoclasticus B316]